MDNTFKGLYVSYNYAGNAPVVGLFHALCMLLKPEALKEGAVCAYNAAYALAVKHEHSC